MPIQVNWVNLKIPGITGQTNSKRERERERERAPWTHGSTNPPWKMIYSFETPTNTIVQAVSLLPEL